MTGSTDRRGPEIIVLNVGFDGTGVPVKSEPAEDENTAAFIEYLTNPTDEETFTPPRKNGVCVTCDRVHASDETRATGRFNPDGPTGYLAILVPGAEPRATREEARAETCAWFASNR
jgi:hypothetical protein